MKKMTRQINSTRPSPLPPMTGPPKKNPPPPNKRSRTTKSNITFMTVTLYPTAGFFHGV